MIYHTQFSAELINDVGDRRSKEVHCAYFKEKIQTSLSSSALHVQYGFQCAQWRIFTGVPTGAYNGLLFEAPYFLQKIPHPPCTPVHLAWHSVTSGGQLTRPWVTPCVVFTNVVGTLGRGHRFEETVASGDRCERFEKVCEACKEGHKRVRNLCCCIWDDFLIISHWHWLQSWSFQIGRYVLQ